MQISPDQINSGFKTQAQSVILQSRTGPDQRTQAINSLNQLENTKDTMRNKHSDLLQLIW